jgi:hypothetical protein
VSKRTYIDVGLDGKYLLEPDEVDEDLAWVEREIRKCEDGPRFSTFDNPEMNRIRNERLERLRKMRSKLLGEGP